VKCQMLRVITSGTKLFAESNIVVRLCLIGVLLMSCLTFGCRKKKDTQGIYTLNLCKAIIDTSEFPERNKKLARKALDQWDNKVLDPEPILIHAGYTQSTNHGYWLFLTMLDEDFDISGFVVKEMHEKSNSDVVVIEEKYPVFPESTKIGDFQYLDFSERKDLSHTKDEKAWVNYINAGPDREIFYRRGDYPTIWISLPNPPKVEVKLWIYDSTGNKSEPIRLEYGFPRRKKPDK